MCDEYEEIMMDSNNNYVEAAAGNNGSISTLVNNGGIDDSVRIAMDRYNSNSNSGTHYRPTISTSSTLCNSERSFNITTTNNTVDIGESTRSIKSAPSPATTTAFEPRKELRKKYHPRHRRPSMNDSLTSIIRPSTYCKVSDEVVSKSESSDGVGNNKKIAEGGYIQQNCNDATSLPNRQTRRRSGRLHVPLIRLSNNMNNIMSQKFKRVLSFGSNTSHTKKKAADTNEGSSSSSSLVLEDTSYHSTSSSLVLDDNSSSSSSLHSIESIHIQFSQSMEIFVFQR